MQARIISWFNGILAKWKGLTRTQRIHVVTIAAGTLLAMGVLVFVLARPSYSEFVRAQNGMEVRDIQSALEAEAIPSKADGLTVLVRDEDMIRAQVAYDLMGLASTTTNMSWPDVLDATGMGTSSKVIDQTMILFTQSQIEKKLMQVKGIDTANVTLNIPNSTSFYFPTEEVPTASVVISTSSSFNKSIGDSLGRIVAKSVNGLSLDNVFIMDQNGAVIFSGEVAQNGEYNTRKEVEAAYLALTERGIRSIMSPLCDEVKIAANLNFDWNVVSEETIKYLNPYGDDSQQGFISEDHTIKQSISNATPEGEVGLNANDVTTSTYVTGNSANSEQSLTEFDRSFLYDVIRSISNSDPGKILYGNSSIAVTAIQYRSYKESVYQANPIEGMTWEQYKESLPRRTTVTGDQDLVRLIQAGTGISRVELLMVEIPLFEDMTVTAVRVNEIVMLVLTGLMIALFAYMLLRRAKPEEITELEPELSVEDLLVSTQIEEEKEQVMVEEERLREIELNKESETKLQIEKFIELRPESAAQLLRNWLNEDWD